MPFKKFGGTGIAHRAMGIKWAFAYYNFIFFCTFELKFEFIYNLGLQSKGFCSKEPYLWKTASSFSKTYLIWYFLVWYFYEGTDIEISNISHQIYFVSQKSKPIQSIIKIVTEFQIFFLPSGCPGIAH